MTTTLEPLRPSSLLEPKASRWDEMWEGELYMPPMPNSMHQTLRKQLSHWLTAKWEDPPLRRVFDEHNLTTESDADNWNRNYRVPDIILLDAPRFGINKGEFMAGAPLVVVEIRSMGDKSYDKLDFYAELGDPEVWIIDRSSRHPEVFALGNGAYTSRTFDADGWLRSPATGAEFRRTDDGLLRVRMNGDDATISDLPLY